METLLRLYQPSGAGWDEATPAPPARGLLQVTEDLEQRAQRLRDLTERLYSTVGPL